MLTILVLSYTKFWLNIYPKSEIRIDFDRSNSETSPSPSANPPKKYFLASEIELLLSTSLSC